MNAQHAGGTGFAVVLGEEAESVFAGRGQGAEIAKKIAEFRVLMRPSSGADVAPQLGFLGRDEPHADGTLLLCGGLLDGPAKNIAYLYRFVLAVAE